MNPNELELEVLDEGTDDTEVVPGCCTGGTGQARN